MHCAKYIAVFRISWQRELEYRFNFILGRLRNILTMLLLYFVWISLTKRTGMFAGYSRDELVTYVFGVNILRAIIQGNQSKQVVIDINEGLFSAYLVMPMSYLLRTFSAELAPRIICFLTSLAEVVLFGLLLQVTFFLQREGILLLLFIASLAMAVVLFFAMSYLISLLAFWSREAMGPRFLFDWVLEFASGAYFPLDILPAPALAVVQALPFAGIIYLPLQIYLGRLSPAAAAAGILQQALWTGIIGLVLAVAWRRGLKRYTGEGM